ncbi:MAG: helix-hairpin-helix domain-containing protein [Bacteroidales bacterium]|nr:helix-hairpin-helix domain-containing protein [Bacteroidales bacterium]
MKKEEDKGFSKSTATGLVALIFLMIGYQTALFVHNAAVTKIVANRDEPDTVYVYMEKGEAGTGRAPIADKVLKTERKNASHSSRAEAVRSNLPRKKVESFRFNPNLVTHEDLCRLGFSPKQAQSIVNYREKGGKFRRKSDFAKSFVVSDSIYRRLEKYIDIPLTDLNLADSAAFDALPGIGGWFSKKILEHRSALGGYSYPQQLMDIRNFDQDKFDALSDLITVSPEHVIPYPLWTLPADSLKKHPYIRNMETARAIVLFRENNPREKWTVEELRLAGILSDDNARRLSRCRLQ